MTFTHGFKIKSNTFKISFHENEGMPQNQNQECSTTPDTQRSSFSHRDTCIAVQTEIVLKQEGTETTQVIIKVQGPNLLTLRQVAFVISFCIFIGTAPAYNELVYRVECSCALLCYRYVLSTFQSIKDGTAKSVYLVEF